jgi:hypothetical protein
LHEQGPPRRRLGVRIRIASNSIDFMGKWGSRPVKSTQITPVSFPGAYLQVRRILEKFFIYQVSCDPLGVGLEVKAAMDTSMARDIRTQKMIF